MMRATPFIASGLALVTVLWAASPAFADNLVVSVDHTMRLAVQGQAASVVVGNAKVADVSVVDSHTLFVSGRTVGLTDVVVLDGLGRTIYASEVSVTDVGPGTVAVYRGSARTNLACAPSCSVTVRPDDKAGAAAATPAPTPPTP